MKILLIMALLLITPVYSVAQAEYKAGSEVATEAPSSETYNEIMNQTNNSITTKSGDIGAPPGGDHIGGVPVGAAPLGSLLIPIGLYWMLKRKKK